MRVELSGFVERDLEEIADWIAEDNPLRAVTFIQEIREAFRRIGEFHPLSATLPRARFSRTLGLMEVHFTPEQEAKLAQSAAQQGRNPDELVRQVVARYFDEESRFVDAVRRGEDALQRGEYLTHEQVGQRLERFLQP